MTDKEKLERILNSYTNGQKKQMVNQIKAYGQARFFIDYAEYVQDWGSDVYARNFVVITKVFFLLK